MGRAAGAVSRRRAAASALQRMASSTRLRSDESKVTCNGNTGRLDWHQRGLVEESSVPDAVRCRPAPDPGTAVYRPRQPQLSPLYRLVADYAEAYERVYDERFAHEYGPWRPHVADVLARFLTCGDLRHGFARV